MLEFSLLLLTLIALPHVLATVLRVHKFFPIFFIQLLLGVLITNSNVFQGFMVSQHINHGFWAQSFGYMGWLGIAFVITLSSSEATEYHSQQGDRRFLYISVLGFTSSFVLNAGMAWFALYLSPDLLGTAHNKWLFALSLGLSLSVTAVPVLVAITQDLDMISPLVRNTAISTALMDDLWLWLGIGVVLTMLPNAGYGETSPWMILLSLLLYLAVAFWVVKRLLVWFLARFHLNSAQKLLLVLSTILLSSTMTEYIGLHSIFGVFIAGLILPAGLLHEVRPALLDMCNTILVPLFFITSGMKINLSGLNVDFFLMLVFFSVAATSSKFIAVSVIAKVLGFRWTDSFVLGVLMQCKGLMELVVANVLLETGLINHQMFAILSIYALISTVLTTPLVKSFVWMGQHFKEAGENRLET